MADYGVHRITRRWVEDEADWNKASKDTPWTNPGGDFVSEALDEQRDVSRNDGSRWIGFNVLDAVKDYVVNPDENFGFLVMNEFFAQEMDVASSEFEDAELRPKLTIEYSVTGIDHSRKQPVLSTAKEAISLTTANRQLTVANNSTALVSLVLSRLDGTIVSTGSLTGGIRKTLSAGGAGVYLISVYGNGKTLHKRISLLP